MTNKYETIFVLSVKAADEEALAASTEKFKTLITDNGGTIEDVNVWGKRRLAYPINYETEGYYVLVTFEAEPSFIAELNRIYGITEGVLRSIVVRK